VPEPFELADELPLLALGGLALLEGVLGSANGAITCSIRALSTAMVSSRSSM